MADYLGTDRDDVLDQQSLRLADWSGTIRGLGGNDRITGGNIHIQGGAGNDLLIGTTPFSTVNYYDAPAGVRVDLEAGTAQDGWGGLDTIRNVHVVHGSNHADWFKGSALADNFWVGAGDVVLGGRGVDTVTIWENSGRWKIVKVSGQHMRAVQTDSGKYVDLYNVEKIQFQDSTVPLFYSEKLVYQDQTPSVLPAAFVFCYSADLNQDGRWDLVIGGGIFPPFPSQETPVQVLLQQADGQFLKAVITNGVEGFVHPREMASGDFNGDGLTDVVVIGHGYDTSPFPGETPTVLWGRTDGTFRDGSESMPQTPAFTHSVAVADVNLDGVDDIFLGNIWGQRQFTPRLLLGTSNSQFVESELPRSIGVNAFETSGTVPVASLLKDVTGDGRVDLVAGGGDSGVFIYPGLAVKPGQMAANFFAERLPLPTGRFGTGTVTVDIQSHDINQDGLPDLLISQSSNSYQGRAVQLLLQGPQGQWRDETDQRLHNWDFSSEWITFIHLVDLNQDGHHDLLASGTSARGDVVFINDGTGHFSPAGSSNGFPALSGAWLVPAETGKLLSVAHSSTGLISVRSIALDAGLTGPDSALPAVMGAPGFNEQFYLRHHPSLAADVAAGRIESGLASYLATGRALGERAYAPGTTVWGSTGLDAVHYAGRSSQYTVSLGSTGDWQLTGGSTGAAHDVFKSIERIHFQGTSLSLDLPSSAGQVAKTLGAVFGKESVANKAFVGIGLHFVDELQYSYTSLMQLAINARLGANPTHAQVVDLLYTNVVGQAPDAVTRKTFTDLLDNGTFTVGGLGVLAADTELNQTNIKLVGLAQTGLEYLPFGG